MIVNNKMIIQVRIEVLVVVNMETVAFWEVM
jgi:hypothetical protein